MIKADMLRGCRLLWGLGWFVIHLPSGMGYLLLSKHYSRLGMENMLNRWKMSLLSLKLPSIRKDT